MEYVILHSHILNNSTRKCEYILHILYCVLYYVHVYRIILYKGAKQSWCRNEISVKCMYITYNPLQLRSPDNQGAGEISLQFSEIFYTSSDSKASYLLIYLTAILIRTPVNREAETTTRLDTDSKREGEDNSAPCVIFFPLRKFHVWLESSSALRPAHFLLLR